jgi:hypothetical protein
MKRFLTFQTRSYAANRLNRGVQCLNVHRGHGVSLHACLRSSRACTCLNTAMLHDHVEFIQKCAIQIDQTLPFDAIHTVAIKLQSTRGSRCNC